MCNEKRLFVNENENYFIRTGIRLVSNLSKSIGQYANVAIGSEVSFVKSVVYYFTRRRIKSDFGF